MFDAGHVFECDVASRVSHDPYRSHRERQHEKNAMIDSRFHASKKRRSDFDVGNAGICVLICPYVQRDVTNNLYAIQPCRFITRNRTSSAHLHTKLRRDMALHAPSSAVECRTRKQGVSQCCVSRCAACGEHLTYPLRLSSLCRPVAGSGQTLFECGTKVRTYARRH